MQYCNAKVIWEAHGPQDAYGDITYLPGVTIKARKQVKTEIVTTKEGKELLSKHLFYVSPTEGSSIAEMDKLDGELIVEKYEMRSLGNQIVLIRFTTV